MEIYFTNEKHVMNDLILFSVSKVETRRIRKCLKEQAIVIESTCLVGLRGELQEQLNDPSISEEEKKEIKSKINSVQRKIITSDYFPKTNFSMCPHQHSIGTQYLLTTYGL